eukprot:12394665-Ditylum_brightwellii.AAC.1
MQINQLVTLRQTLWALQSSVNLGWDQSDACNNYGVTISAQIHTKQMAKSNQYHVRKRSWKS